MSPGPRIAESHAPCKAQFCRTFLVSGYLMFRHGAMCKQVLTFSLMQYIDIIQFLVTPARFEGSDLTDGVNRARRLGCGDGFSCPRRAD